MSDEKKNLINDEDLKDVAGGNTDEFDQYRIKDDTISISLPDAERNTGTSASAFFSAEKK